MANFSASVAKVKQGIFSFGNSERTSFEVSSDILRASSRAGPFDSLCQNGTRCNGCTTAKGFEFSLCDLVSLYFDEHLHNIAAGSISHCTHAIRAGNLPHIFWILKMLH